MLRACLHACRTYSGNPLFSLHPGASRWRSDSRGPLLLGVSFRVSATNCRAGAASLDSVVSRQNTVKCPRSHSGGISRSTRRRRPIMALVAGSGRASSQSSYPLRAVVAHMTSRGRNNPRVTGRGSGRPLPGNPPARVATCERVPRGRRASSRLRRVRGRGSNRGASIDSDADPSTGRPPEMRQGRRPGRISGPQHSQHAAWVSSEPMLDEVRVAPGQKFNDWWCPSVLGGSRSLYRPGARAASRLVSGWVYLGTDRQCMRCVGLVSGLGAGERRASLREGSPKFLRSAESGFGPRWEGGSGGMAP